MKSPRTTSWLVVSGRFSDSVSRSSESATWSRSASIGSASPMARGPKWHIRSKQWNCLIAPAGREICRRSWRRRESSVGGVRRRRGRADGRTEARVREHERIVARAGADETNGAKPDRVGSEKKGARQYLTPEDAAETLGVRVQTIRGYIRSGRLPAFWLAGERAIRILRADLEKS